MMNKVRLDQTNAKVERHNMAISIELLCNNYINRQFFSVLKIIYVTAVLMHLALQQKWMTQFDVGTK